MTDTYKFDPVALRKKLAEESGTTIEALDEVKGDEAPAAPSHADVFKGFADAKLDTAKPQKEDNLLPILGGIAGGMAQYKGLGSGLFHPDPSLFLPTQFSGTQAQPTNAPMTNVEHTMQSGQGQRPGETGRQRENTHNQETQRQSWATEQKVGTPEAKKVVVEAGPMYTTKSGIGIPLNTAMSMQEQLDMKQAAEAEERRQILAKQAANEQRKAAVAGAVRGTARMGQGIVGGAIAAPQLYEYAKNVANNKPADNTQLASGIGGLMMALGKNKMGVAGGLAQLPYAIKHRNELARSQLLSDLVPDVIRMGMTGSELYEPALRESDRIPPPPPSVAYPQR